jgi:hypothetical protein
MVLAQVKNFIPTLSKYQSFALGLLGALALGISPAQAINIGINPQRIHLDISSNKTRSQSVRILNLDSKPIELKVYVQSWVMDDKNELQTIPPQEQSLEQWIVYTPSRFVIPPRGAQTIRFAVRPRVKPKSGEHRAVMFVEEIPSKDSTNSKSTRIIARLGVPIYGYVGDIKRVGVLNSVNVDTKTDNLNAIFDISSQGNGYVRLNGQYSIWPADKYPGAEATKPIEGLGKPDTKIPENLVDAGLLPQAPVLPDSRRRLLLPIKKKLPPGKYVLDINGELNGVIIQKGVPFTVPANLPVASNRSRNQPPSQKLRDSLRNPQQRK